MSEVIQGTIAELISKNIQINGQKLGQAELSVLTRLGRGTFAIEVGQAPRPQGTKGKPATIWKFNPSAVFDIGYGTNDPAPVASATE